MSQINYLISKIVALLILCPYLSFADPNNSTFSNRMMGFNYKNEIINPACINLLQPWISDNGMIIRSLIVDNCQNSNQAYAGKNYSVSESGEVYYYSDKDDAHTYFSYKVIARTLNNIFVLFHSGHIGLYRLEEKSLRTNFAKKAPESVTVLTKVSDAFVPCFRSASTSGNELFVSKNVWDSYAARANQCTEKQETLKFNLDGF